MATDLCFHNIPQVPEATRIVLSFSCRSFCAFFSGTLTSPIRSPFRLASAIISVADSMPSIPTLAGYPH